MTKTETMMQFMPAVGVPNLRVLLTNPFGEAMSRRWYRRALRVEWGRAEHLHPNSYATALSVGFWPRTRSMTVLSRLFSRGPWEPRERIVTMFGVTVHWSTKR